MSPGREHRDESDAGDGRTRDLYEPYAHHRPNQAELTPPGTTDHAADGSDMSEDAATRVAKKTDLPESLERTRPSVGGTTMTTGRTIFDKYVVVRRLGEGGMGEVWLVRHLDLDAERALKLIISNVSFNAEHRARFRREARVMARFVHPNVVAVHDAVVRPDGNTAYIEMEYVRGKSLKETLEPGVPMPLDWTARIVEQLCGALQVAHENGIVHRDLKPTNLMLLDDQPPGQEHLKVLDFGIAKILGAEQADPEGLLSRTGAPLGTPQYMSPEQILANPSQVDARSDLYAVGLILYELLTGHRAYDGSFHKLIYQHLHVTPAPFADINPDLGIPPEVERVVFRCLEKDPALRPQSARVLADEFRRAAAPPVPDSSTALVATKTRGRWVWAIPALLLLGLVIWGGAWWFLTPSFRLLAPADLTLRAGDSTMISVSLQRHRLRGKAEIVPVGTTEGITVLREMTTNPDYVPFRIEADLNRFAATKTATLTFRAIAGGEVQATTLRLRIEPPAVTLPPNCVPLAGSRYERVGTRNLASRIARIVPGTGADEASIPVTFLLVKEARPGDPDSFYIMEDKVWNALFARFVREHKEIVENNIYWREIANGSLPLEEAKARMPATNMSGREAYLFAEWLGGKLPRYEQWDKAAGAFDRRGRIGPYDGTWNPGDKTGIAIGRTGIDEGPLPVGTAAQDVSVFGCRDMAGNGTEWTRNSQTEGHLIPLAVSENILLRGRSYTASKPLLFEDLNDSLEREAEDYLLGALEDLGFRVVIETDDF